MQLMVHCNSDACSDPGGPHCMQGRGGPVVLFIMLRLCAPQSYILVALVRELLWENSAYCVCPPRSFTPLVIVMDCLVLAAAEDIHLQANYNVCLGPDHR